MYSTVEYQHLFLFMSETNVSRLSFILTLDGSITWYAVMCGAKTMFLCKLIVAFFMSLPDI